ncbi:unnamed protein product [Colias eurytheme]|nr:unnamed protein product [Colias eurytheme]
MNRNKTIFAKRNHFPLVSACALTIHKSPGGTFDQIVYEYNKSHSQQLLYVALSRVTDINGLFIVSNTDDNKFYHGRKRPGGIVDLQCEFERLSNSRLITQQEELYNLVNESNITLFSFNCQSLRAHVSDLNDKVLKRSTLLLFSETWMKNDEQILIENFYCVTQYNRPNSTAGGVAVYHSSTDTLNNVTPIQNISQTILSQISDEVSQIGDIALVRCVNTLEVVSVRDLVATQVICTSPVHSSLFSCSGDV